jgi:hypothetical protein
MVTSVRALISTAFIVAVLGASAASAAPALPDLQITQTVSPVTLVTRPTVTGTQENRAQVVGDLTETTLANNTVSATANVRGSSPPPLYCTEVTVRPKEFFVAQRRRMHLVVLSHLAKVIGVRVRITGVGLDIVTKRSNSKGRVDPWVDFHRTGVLSIRPIGVKKVCHTTRAEVVTSIPPPIF